MYNLDFDTIKQVMKEHRKTGKLSSETPMGIADIPGPCSIEVILKDGVAVSYFITGSDGHRLAVKEPAQHLARLGHLQWTFTAQDESRARTSISAAPSAVSSFPQRTVSLNPGQMRSWTRLHRMVYALADGTKSVERIAAMLSTTPDQVEKALIDLQAIGAVSTVSR